MNWMVGQCVLCRVFVSSELVVGALVVESDGRTRCVNVRTCERRLLTLASLAAATARRHVPGLGWVGSTQPPVPRAAAATEGG